MRALFVLLAFIGAARADVSAVPTSGTSLRVSWAPPPNDGGAAITKYRVEWDSKPGMQEEQRITLQGATSGTFALSFRGQRTVDLQHDAPAATVRTALEALLNVGSVNVKGSASAGYTVRFVTNVGDLPTIRVHKAGLVGTSVSADVQVIRQGSAPPFDEGTHGITQAPLGTQDISERAEVQTITVSTKDQDLNGHFRMSFMGAISYDVKHDATADEMRRALQSMYRWTR